MAPPQAITILFQMEYTSVQVFYLWFPDGCHIWPKAAGLTSVMSQEVTRIVAHFGPRRLFESDSNDGPSPGHSNLVSDGICICSDVLVIVSWWVPFSWWAPILVPGVYSSPTQMMAHPQAIPILCRMVYAFVQVSYLLFPSGCHIWPRAAGLTSLMA